MVRKYFKDETPQPGASRGEDEELKAAALSLIDTYTELMSELSFHKALMAIWDLIGRINKYIDTMAPWVLAKSDRDRLATVMFHILETLKIISVLQWPFTPESSEKIQRFMGLSKIGPELDLAGIRQWGVERPVKGVSKVTQLFPRVEANKEDTPTKGKKSMETSKGDKSLISFKEFQALDLRIGVVTHAEAIPGSKKLLKLTVDIGEERTLVAGLVGHYSAEELPGKQVVVVANLEPAKLMGVESRGMVLAAEDESGVHLLLPDAETKPGSSVR
jgi:methionyl-tRNA synthetase